jgi:hypothetical protein
MRDRRRSESMMVAVSAVLFAVCATAGEFEVPPVEPAAASLPAELVSGRHFTVREPVRADGLMHHYELQSRFGARPRSMRLPLWACILWPCRACRT